MPDKQLAADVIRALYRAPGPTLAQRLNPERGVDLDAYLVAETEDEDAETQEEDERPEQVRTD